jgi:hypothetical protein
MNARYRFWVLLFSAVALGNLIGWIDSRPTWDDAGITVAMVLGAASVLGFAGPDRAWLWALAVSIWVPLWNIVVHASYASVVALVIAVTGAYMGAFIRRALLPRT